MENVKESSEETRPPAPRKPERDDRCYCRRCGREIKEGLECDYCGWMPEFVKARRRWHSLLPLLGTISILGGIGIVILALILPMGSSATEKLAQTTSLPELSMPYLVLGLGMMIFGILLCIYNELARQSYLEHGKDK